MFVAVATPAPRRWTLLAAGLALSLIWFATALPVRATEHLVLADGSGPYPSIQHAIDAAAQGDTVVVGAGIYTGVDNRDFNTENDMLIRAQYPGDEVIIDLQGSAADPHMGFDVVDGSLSLEGLTIQNAYAIYGAVRVRSANFTADNCNFFNNTADRGGAIISDGADNLFLTGCVLAGNKATIEGGAIYATLYGEVHLTNCTLFMNESVLGSVIYRHQEATLDMESCIVAYSRGPYTFADYYGGAVTIANTDIWGNEGGNWTGGLGSLLGTNGNITANPLLCDPMDGNFDLTSSSPCWIPPSLLMGARDIDLDWDVPVYGLKDDGTGMYPNIQAAVDAVPYRVDIVLEPGSYGGAGNQNIEFGGNWIELSVRDGGFAGIYPRSHTSEPPARAFHLHQGEPVGTAIRGVYIAGGSADGLPSLPGFGGAILVTGGASLIVEDVEFYLNFASFGGSVLAVVGSAGEVTMSDCTISSSRLSEAVYASGGTLEIVDTNFGANNDGSLEFASGVDAVTVRNAWIHDTEGIYAIDLGSVPLLFEDCRIQTQTAFTPTRILACDDVTFRRCDFESEGVTDGELLHLQLSQVVVDSCTFVGEPVLDSNVVAVDASRCTLDMGATSFVNLGSDPSRGTVVVGGASVLSLDACTFSGIPEVFIYEDTADLDLTMTDCTITAAETAVRIAGTALDHVTITGTEFVDCARGLDFTGCPDVVLTDCGFRGTGPEEPVRAVDTDLVVIGCEFHDGEVWDGPGDEAGAILAEGGSLSVHTSEFLRNRCGAGAGAIGTRDLFVSINDCLFTDNDNVATISVESGGAISVQGGGLFLGGTRLERNTAYEGGAVFVVASSLTIDTCEIIENTAASDGGGVYLNTGLAGFVTVVNTQFVGNTASEEGSACYLQEGQSVDLYRCTFVGNGGSAGTEQIFTNGTTTLDIHYSIIAFGTDGPVVDTSHVPSLTLNVSCTDIVGNAAGDWTGVLAPFAGLAGNVSLHPGFCDRAAGDYHLAADSPCLGPANGCGATMGALDVGCGNVSAVPDAPVIHAVTLRQNQPNPFNPSTRILFELPAEADVTLKIYDLAGRLVRELLASERFPYGGHEVTWNGRDDRGRAQATGIYLYRLQADGIEEVRKMTLVR